MALTDLKVRNARKTAQKNYKLSDGHGLHLLVTRSGGRLWRWKYRFAGKEKLMSFGTYPEISLSAAREALFNARRTLAKGVDPMAERKLQKESVREVENPFRQVAELWFEKWRTDKNSKYVENTDSRLRNDVLSVIGQRPIDEIQSPELVEMILAIESRGASDVARRAHQMTSQIFRFGIAHGLCRQNPAEMFRPSDVLKTVRVVNFARVEKSELPRLFKKIEYYDGSPVTRLALKLMALVFLRTSELIGGEWGEINFKEARWDIAKQRMKGGTRSHIIPLSNQAISVLETLWNYRKNDRWMFPGDRSAEKHMSNNTILKALEHMGYKGEMTGHGFRGVASTLLHENGFDHEHIEMQLAHAPENDVSAAYNFAKYFEPRKEMMQWWADYIDRLLEETDRASQSLPNPPVAN
jgi:integrase